MKNATFCLVTLFIIVSQAFVEIIWGNINLLLLTAEGTSVIGLGQCHGGPAGWCGVLDLHGCFGR